ncbi:NERD domain-containing protein [Nocardia sp. NPDC024068]|uniref:nuclease-related domain-containing protein n=1 Tax=Nocardia sp. NPDC024068 TaxID=3157197 RepID=UPI00340C92CB
MLVIADKLRSGAEKRVAGWLRRWEGDYRVPGVAIMNCYLAGQEVDLVVVTPHTTLVGEIKGVDPRVTGGVLQCTTNSPWQVPEFEGDPVGVRGDDTTPYDQVREAVFKLKAAAGQLDGGGFISGLVVVVPPRGSAMRLEKKSAPPQGCDVLLCGTQNPLRAWFHRAHHRSAVVWTAEQAYALVEALEYGGRTTVAALADEGFPLESALPAPSSPTPISPAPESAAAAGSGESASPPGSETGRVSPAGPASEPEPVPGEPARKKADPHAGPSSVVLAAPSLPISESAAPVVTSTPHVPAPNPRSEPAPPAPPRPPEAPGLPESDTSPTHPPGTDSPTYPPDAASPTHPPGTDSPTHPPDAASPTHPPGTDSRTHPPDAASPTTPPSRALPTPAPGAASLAAPPTHTDTDTDTDTAAGTPPRPEPAPHTPAEPGPVQSGHRRAHYQTAAAFAVIAALGAGLWLLGRAGGETAPPETVPEQQISSVAEQPVVAPPPAAVPPRPPAPAPPSARTCFPFQPNC